MALSHLVRVGGKCSENLPLLPLGHLKDLFAIAYRMLGSVADAEEVVQEAFLRYHAAEVEPESPKAYLATIATRLAIDHLRSARTQREGLSRRVAPGAACRGGRRPARGDG